MTNRDTEKSVYDVRQWGRAVFPYDSLSEFLERLALHDGIHQIKIADNQYLDIWFQGFSLIGKNAPEVLLVGLSGAIANRSDKSPPFFSGLGLATEMKLPIISISDPSISLNEDLSLSWYAGNQSAADLPLKIAKVIEEVSKKLSIPALIFGGSGAGFAGLVLSSLINIEAKFLVWNPQTSISAYQWKPVSHYIESAFPLLRGRIKGVSNLAYADRAPLLFSALEEAGIKHHITANEVKERNCVLYLQNYSDSGHIIPHAKPFCISAGWRRLGASSFVTERGNIAVFFGEWGEGHAYPPRKLLVESLRLLIDKDNVSDVVSAVESSASEWSINVPYFHCFFGKKPTYIRIKSALEVGVVRVQCNVEEGERSASVLKFAFYLLQDGKKIQTKWYSNSSVAEFQHDGSPGALEVVVFVQDAFGEKLILGSYPVIPEPSL